MTNAGAEQHALLRAASSSSSQQALFKAEESRYSHENFNFQQTFTAMCDRLFQQQTELSSMIKAVDKRLGTIEARPPVALPESTGPRSDNPWALDVPPPPQPPTSGKTAAEKAGSSQPTQEGKPRMATQSTPRRRRRSNSVSTPVGKLSSLPEAGDGDDTPRRKRRDDGSKSRKQSKAFGVGRKAPVYNESVLTVNSDDDSDASSTASSQNAKKPYLNLKWPKFNGKNLHIFKPRFEAVAERKGLTEKEKLEVLHEVFIGDAERVFQWVPPNSGHTKPSWTRQRYSLLIISRMPTY